MNEILLPERPRAPRGAGAATPAPASRWRAEAARALEADLRANVEGEVRFDAASRALYATDASNYRQVPIAVVAPRRVEDVIATVAACRAHGAPILSRGGGTSLAGQCCNVAVVMDHSKYLDRILELDPGARRARVEPGLVLDRLRREAERHRLTFGPDPATHDRCTLGGMIGNDSCGVHSVMAGRTVDNVLRLEVLTADGERRWVGPMTEAEVEAASRSGGRWGEIVAGLRALRDEHAEEIRERFPDIPRRVSGFNLDELLPERGFQVARALVGSEGTCVTVLQAELRLVPSPPGRALLVLGYPDVFAAADDAPRIRAMGPIGLEGIDDQLVRSMERKGLRSRDLRLLPEGRGFLLVELGGEDAEAALARARECREALAEGRGPVDVRLYGAGEEAERVWKIRESGLAATARVPGGPDAWPGWEDSAVPPARLGDYLRELRRLLDRSGYTCALYGHFGDGCVHARIDFELTSRAGLDRYRRFVEEAADLCISFGGSLSGEHGDGQARGELLARMFGPRLVEAMRRFKALWDPEGLMNPGKVVDPAPLDAHLRLGEGYREARPPTRFALREDDGRFGRAVNRCVGVGACRRDEGGVMCPSYRVTREERHSTRGRARLLHEMLVGDPLRGGWRSREVLEALDLCLACKGCRSDCPMQVDMATYKAEFLSHHYAGRLRPRSAYALGLVWYWLRAGAAAPRLANALAHAPGLSRLAKALAGIARERELPRLAGSTFRRWFARRDRVGEVGEPVLLYSDTFNDFLHPETAIAATEVLEASGYRVQIPARRVCCGRPLYDHGMLGLATRLLRRNLEVLEPALRDEIPVVVLEPSCAAVFRDELPALLPDDPRAARLARQTMLLSELIAAAGARFSLPRLERRALVQPHCHHHAVLGLDAEREVLARMGLDACVLDAGCCGMAGAFGFQRGEKYEVSMALAERGLLPAVRAAPEDTLIVANGFSCRSQIAQGTGRRSLHLAEVIRLALDRPTRAPGGP